MALGACLMSASALAAPTVVATRPVADDTGAKVHFLVGGIEESGRSLKTTNLSVFVDGQPATPTAVQSLSDWAAASAEASSSFRPPAAVGLVYLWIEGVPPAVLDGIHAFFQRIPSRTVVYPTIYGRMRQGRARLAAGDISRLDEVPYLDGYRPNLIDAVKLNAADLAADPSGLKMLLLVTDGRDFADPKGEGPGNFAELGARLRQAGITLLVVRYRPEADAAQSAANMRDLHDAAGGFLSARDQVEDLENTLESLGQSVGRSAAGRAGGPLDLAPVQRLAPGLGPADRRRRGRDDHRRGRGRGRTGQRALVDVRSDRGRRCDRGRHDLDGLRGAGAAVAARRSAPTPSSPPPTI